MCGTKGDKVGPFQVSLPGPSQVSLSSLSGSGLSQVSLSLSTQTEPKKPSGTFNDTDTYIRTWRAASLQLKIWLVVVVAC